MGVEIATAAVMKSNKRGRAEALCRTGVTALLGELATVTGLPEAVSGAMLDTYWGSPVHAPGEVFSDLAVAIADGADTVTRLGCYATGRPRSGRWPRCRRRGGCWTTSMSPHIGWCGRRGTPTPVRLGRPAQHPIRQACCGIDFDATIASRTARSRTQAATWKKTFGPPFASAARLNRRYGEAEASLASRHGLPGQAYALSGSADSCGGLSGYTAYVQGFGCARSVGDRAFVG
jgi:hypothetical protein